MRVADVRGGPAQLKLPPNRSVYATVARMTLTIHADRLPRAARPNQLPQAESLGENDTAPSADKRHLRWLLAGLDLPDELPTALLAEFGSFAAVVAADPSRHLRVTGNASAARQLASFRDATLYLVRSRIAAKPLMSCWQDLLDYLRCDLAHRTIECVRVLFLGTRNQLINDELMWSGTIDHCSIHVRQVIARALELDAAALILVHNHPGGDATPSRADIDVTRAVINAGRPLGITVHDHIIITPLSHSSMRTAGLI
jgi:DNA repair protein RadC